MNREEYINKAKEQFEKLLREQLERCDRMGNEDSVTSGDGMITIGLIDGDGIGPIIMNEAGLLLEKLLEDEIKAGKVCLKKIEDLPSLEDRMGETGRQTEYCMLSATTGQLQRLENQLPVQSW